MSFPSFYQPGTGLFFASQEAAEAALTGQIASDKAKQRAYADKLFAKAKCPTCGQEEYRGSRG